MTRPSVAAQMQAHFDQLEAQPVPASMPDLNGGRWTGEDGAAVFGAFHVRLDAVLLNFEALKRPTSDATGSQIVTHLTPHGPLFAHSLQLTSKALTIQMPQAYAPAFHTALTAWERGHPGRLSLYASDDQRHMTFLTGQRHRDQRWIGQAVWNPRQPPQTLRVRTVLKDHTPDPLYERLSEQMRELSTLAPMNGFPANDTFSRAEVASYRDLAGLMADAALRLSQRPQAKSTPDVLIRYSPHPDRPYLHQAGLTATVDIQKVSAWTLHSPGPNGAAPRQDPVTEVTLRTVFGFPVVRLWAQEDAEILLPEELTVLLSRLLQDCTPGSVLSGQLSFRSAYPLLGVPTTSSPSVTYEITHLGQGHLQLRETRHAADRTRSLTLDPEQVQMLARLCHEVTRQHLTRHHPA